MKLRGYYRKLRFIKESRAPHSVTENSGKKKTFNFDPYLSYPCCYKHQHVRSFHYLSLNMKDIQFYNLHQGTFWGVFGELCFKDLFFFSAVRFSLEWGRLAQTRNVCVVYAAHFLSSRLRHAQLFLQIYPLKGNLMPFAAIDLIGFSKNCKGINVNASILHDRGGILE